MNQGFNRQDREQGKYRSAQDAIQREGADEGQGRITDHGAGQAPSKGFNHEYSPIQARIILLCIIDVRCAMNNIEY